MANKQKDCTTCKHHILFRDNPFISGLCGKTTQPELANEIWLSRKHCCKGRWWQPIETGELQA